MAACVMAVFMRLLVANVAILKKYNKNSIFHSHAIKSIWIENGRKFNLVCFKSRLVLNFIDLTRLNNVFVTSTKSS